MSGHSKWNNIKNRKGAQDKKRSDLFTKASRNILTALRTGTGLESAIAKAKEVNMPKENIDRLVSRFNERRDNLVNFMLEAFGPCGVPIMIEVETDNKNRKDLVFLGNITTTKNLTTILNALKEVSVYEKDIKLNIIGNIFDLDFKNIVKEFK